MVELGHKVICLGPEAGFEQPLQELGADYRQIPLHRTGLNPLKDVKTLFSLRKVLRETKPDVFFHIPLSRLYMDRLLRTWQESGECMR